MTEKLIYLDGNHLKRFIINGGYTLWKNREKVDQMNVFPVPDGDTGTNMSFTIKAVIEGIKDVDDANISNVAKIISDKALRGARGNSGVILSQILRGFYKGVKGKEQIDVKELALSLKSASDMAFNAVMKPKEGTILTIIKSIGEKALEISEDTDDILILLSEILNHGNEVLSKTPDMLPQLKNAGVVDSGGQGLMFIFEGGYSHIGSVTERTYKQIEASSDLNDNANKDTQFSYAGESKADIEFSYCTEFFVNCNTITTELENEFKTYLDGAGDSLVMVSGDDFIKVHVHTNHPGEVIEKAIKIGELENIKIENMRIQHTSIQTPTQMQEPTKESTNEPTQAPIENITPYKKHSFIAVSSGDGFNEMLNNLGIDHVLDGGSMRSSTESFLNAIEQCNSDAILIFPNDKDNIMAAKQAQNIDADKNIIIVETQSIPECIEAMMIYNEADNIEETIKEMNEVISGIVVGRITKAAKNTVVDDIKIKANDYIGLINGQIVYKSKRIQSVLKSIINNIIFKAKDLNIITIYYGENYDDKELLFIKKFIEDVDSELEVAIEFGGQSIYNYIITIN